MHLNKLIGSGFIYNTQRVFKIILFVMWKEEDYHFPPNDENFKIDLASINYPSS
jgi:hypothetical protein